MPLNWLRTKFADFRAQALAELADELEDEVGEDLIEALAAATAMVAFADGVPSAEEREELLSVFEEEDRLTEVDLDDLFDAFDDYAERFEEDAAAAENEVLTAVAVFDDSPELGRLIVRAALAVASTDGTLGPAEEKAVARLCNVLALEIDEIRKPVTHRRREDRDLDEEDETDEE
jgi:tellurite resistance protein TerB